MTPQQANLAPCPFCGGPARHLERNPGFYDERAICDPCNYSLSPAAWNRRAPAPTEPAVDRDAVLNAQANAVIGFAEAVAEVGLAPDPRFMVMAQGCAAKIRSLATPASPAVPATPSKILPTTESTK